MVVPTPQVSGVMFLFVAGDVTVFPFPFFLSYSPIMTSPPTRSFILFLWKKE
jgi:hypothetical protein